MQTNKHELTISRGETFTIDRSLFNKDGSPYVISSQLANPYFLLTVSDSLYQRKDGYKLNIWIPVSFPRFEYTRAITIEDFVDSSGGQLYKNGFKGLSGLPSGFINGRNITFEEGDALFYSSVDNRYAYYESGVWKDYNCRFQILFDSEMTSQWSEGVYYYGIELVSGMELNDDSESNKPVKNIDASYPIMRPVKLTVVSNLRGGY